MLKSKIFTLKKQELDEKEQVLKGDSKQGSWGNQIRSYVFHPYKMIKDHRTEYETSNVEAVMDGDLENFVEAYLRWHKISPKKLV
jgi:peptide chain release factor 2